MQELLEAMGIPYTGSGVSACIRAADKVLAKHAMRDGEILTPDFFAFNETAFKELGAAQALPAIEERLQFPIVVKPASQGSALGIKFARTPADVPAALVAAFSYDRKVLLERYVSGRELAVSVIDEDGVPRALPIVEAVPQEENFYDFESSLRDRAHPLRLPRGARRRRWPHRAGELALSVYGLLGCSGFARIDLMLEHETDKLYVLEANPIPGLTETSLLPQAADAAGIGFDELIGRILGAGRETMKPETQRDLLRQFFALRAAHTTTMAPKVFRQRAAVYTDPARLMAETAGLFRGQPLVAGLSADLPGTGDCLAREVAGVPLLLIRGEDAEVRAFLNICRHRGGRVFTGRGRPGRALKCPYHSWAYDLNGDLLGQPLARDAFEELERCEFGLVPLPVAERFGLIFAAVGANGPPVDRRRGGAGRARSRAGRLRLRRAGISCPSARGLFDANWKLIHDTFLETYHVFSLHRNTLAPDMLSTPFVGENFGPHTRGVVMRKEVTKLLERPESEWDLRANASIVYILFPSVAINLPMSGHAELWDMYPEPEDPHRTRVTRPLLHAPRTGHRRGARLLGGQRALHHQGRVRGGLRPAAGHPPLAAQRPDARGGLRAQRAGADPPPSAGGAGSGGLD